MASLSSSRCTVPIDISNRHLPSIGQNNYCEVTINWASRKWFHARICECHFYHFNLSRLLLFTNFVHQLLNKLLLETWCMLQACTLDISVEFHFVFKLKMYIFWKIHDKKLCDRWFFPLYRIFVNVHTFSFFYYYLNRLSLGLKSSISKYKKM